MATASKKYYWLKLKDDFFRDKRIKKLRRIAGGDTYTVIYLKLQLLSLKNNGVLIYEGVEDTFEEELALDIDEDVDNVKITVSFLKANGLIDEEAPNQFTMTETIKCIGSESDSAARVRKHRELKAQQQLALQCNGAVTTSNIEIDIRDKKQELDIRDKKQELDIRDKKQELETKDKMHEESTELAALPANAGDNGQQIVSFEEQAFNEFWKLYPKKVNKKGAFTSFKRIKHLKTELPLILAAVEKFKASKDWQKDNGQFIPHPQTFINQERWKDEKELTREQQLNTIDMQGWV